MEPLEPTRKTRAIMFSDIQGYSRMMDKDETMALRLLEEHNAICTPLIKQSGGTVLKYIGDAILSSFESASDAVHCGIEIQRVLAARNAQQPEGQRIVVRIGIHIGDVVIADGDVLGDGVNIAARIEPLAEPGGIAISQTVYDMIKARPEIRTVSLGAKELKNIKDAINIYKVLVAAHDTPSGAPRRGRLLLAAGAAAALVVGFFLVRHARQPAPAPAAGLVAHWRFDEGSGSVAKDEFGSMDLSPIGAAAWRTGQRGQAGYIPMGGAWRGAQTARLPQGSSPMTAEAWVKLDDSNTQGGTIFWYGTDTTRKRFWLYISGTNCGLPANGRTSLCMAGYFADQSVPHVFEPNRWYHVAFTYDGNWGTFYVDGRPVDTPRPYGPLDITVGKTISVGDLSNGGDGAISIDDARIYDVALSPAQILAGYKSK